MKRRQFKKIEKQIVEGLKNYKENKIDMKLNKQQKYVALKQIKIINDKFREKEVPIT